jgi:aspartate/methionine/tyrosine aminotransferase
MPTLSSAGVAIRPGIFAELQRQIDAQMAKGADLVPLHLGDTYLDPPEAARFESVLSGDEGNAPYRYGPVAGISELREAIAEHLRAKGRAFASIEGLRDVLVGAGATHALSCAARVVLDPGDDVLLLAPYWPLAHGVIQGAGGRAIEVPFTSRLYEDPRLRPADLLGEALTPKTRAIYLITPNNPDGKVLSAGDLADIATFACDHDLWVFADECYADFTYDVPHVSTASLPGMRERTVTAYSFSKSHGLAGARVGYVVAPEAVVAAARRVSMHTVFNVPLVMQRAAAAALHAGPEWTRNALLAYRRARDASVLALRPAPDKASIRLFVPEGGTYLFLDFTEVLGDEPLSRLLERAIEGGVLIAPGAGFGRHYARWGRLCFTAAPLPRVLLGIARLRAAVDALRDVAP